MSMPELPSDLPDDKPDNRILKVCKGLAGTEKDSQVILVTKDIVLRLKAQIMGIRAEDFEKRKCKSWIIGFYRSFTGTL